MKKIINLLLLLVFSFTFSCSNPHTVHRQHTTADVKCAKKHLVDASGNDSWIYYYIIFSNNNGYYTYTSSTPVSSYSNISWTKSSTIPQEMEEEGLEWQDQQVDVAELDPSIEADVATEGSSGTAVSDEEADGGDNDASGDSDSGSDSGSDGGGDGGGGDGGGGGGD